MSLDCGIWVYIGDIGYTDVVNMGYFRVAAYGLHVKITNWSHLGPRWGVHVGVAWNPCGAHEEPIWAGPRCCHVKLTGTLMWDPNGWPVCGCLLGIQR